MPDSDVPQTMTGYSLIIVIISYNYSLGYPFNHSTKHDLKIKRTWNIHTALLGNDKPTKIT